MKRVQRLNEDLLNVCLVSNCLIKVHQLTFRTRGGAVIARKIAVGW